MPAHKITWEEMMKPKLEARPCANPGCRKMFSPDHASKQYCSTACKRGVTAKVQRHCADPKCGKLFTPFRDNHIYCSSKCGDRVKKEKARQAEAARNSHPCKMCGKVITHKRHILCDECIAREKVAQPKGVRQLDTPAIRASRAREQALIDMVVAQAQEKEREAHNLFKRNQPRLSGVRIG